MDNTRVAALADVARQLRDLEKTEGWKALQRVTQARLDKDTNALMSRILSGSLVGAKEQGELYGRVRFAKWILSQPSRVQAELEKELRELEPREDDVA